MSAKEDLAAETAALAEEIKGLREEVRRLREAVPQPVALPAPVVYYYPPYYPYYTWPAMSAVQPCGTTYTVSTSTASLDSAIVSA